jgi:FixJ family two-component response regulator
MTAVSINHHVILMGIAAAIELDDKDHQKLHKMRHSGKAAVRLVERLDIVLLASEGKNNQEIARQLGFSENKVGLGGKVKHNPFFRTSRLAIGRAQAASF